MKCERDSLRKLYTKEIIQCYYCIKSAFFNCKCCFGFVKNSEKCATSTCQAHFYCRVCIMKRREEIAKFCLACTPDEFTECAVCNKIYKVSECRNSHDNHYFCEICYRKCLMSTDLIEKIACEPCKDRVTIAYVYSHTTPPPPPPPPLQPSIPWNPASTCNSGDYCQQNFTWDGYSGNEITTPRISDGRPPQSHNSLPPTTPRNPQITDNWKSYRPIAPGFNIQNSSCDHRRGMAQARNNFQIDFEDLIIQMTNKRYDILNSGKYNLSCPECQTKYCYKFQMFKSNAQSICQKYGLDDNFIQFYGQMFEGKNIGFTECWNCKYCTGYFENNCICYWCRNPLAY